MFVRLMNHECVPETRFISLESVHKADAAGRKGAVVSAFEKKVKCQDWPEKLVGIATDGAEVPHLVGIRCCAHRLELSLKDAAKKSKLIFFCPTCISSITTLL